MDYFANQIINQLTNCMEMESLCSSCNSNSVSSSIYSSVHNEIHQLEDALNTCGSHETEPDLKNYNLRILFETTREQLIHMTPEEIKSIFQMFCKELTSNDYICIKVGTKKNILLNTHNLGVCFSFSFYIQIYIQSSHAFAS